MFTNKKLSESDNKSWIELMFFIFIKPFKHEHPLILIQIIINATDYMCFLQMSPECLIIKGHHDSQS